MAPTTNKPKNTRRAAISATTEKRMRKAGNGKKTPADSGQGNLSRAEDAVTQKLDAITKSMADLSSNMLQKEVEVSPASLHTSCTDRRRATPGGCLTLTKNWMRKYNNEEQRG